MSFTMQATRRSILREMCWMRVKFFCEIAITDELSDPISKRFMYRPNS